MNDEKRLQRNLKISKSLSGRKSPETLRILEMKDEFSRLLSQGLTKKEISEKYNISINSLKRCMKEMGLVFYTISKEKNVFDFLGENAKYLQSSRLKELLYKNNLKQKKCEICGITEWMGKPAPLSLDHINGKNTDNRLENLRILCANCHSQTPTYCSKNRKYQRINRS